MSQQSCLRITSSSARISASVYAAPVGLDGVQSTTALVAGVRVFSSFSADSFQPSSSRVSGSTALAPMMWTCSG